MRGCATLALLVCAFGAWAFPSIPKASAKALGATKGKPFESGLVFVNGKYVKPPYVVERWGTGIRINGRKVTGQVIDWTEFIKTQSGVKVTTTTAPASSPVAVAEPVDDDTSLDDLFDDVESGAKKGKKKASRPRKPQSTTSYSFDGDFTMNAASKALLEKLNAARTDVDKLLRSGGFVFFGDGYSRVSGDSAMTEKILKTLPDALRKCESASGLMTDLRDAGFVFFSEALCQDLYKNRVGYPQLAERRDRWQQDAQVQKLLNNR